MRVPFPTPLGPQTTRARGGGGDGSGDGLVLASSPPPPVDRGIKAVMKVARRRRKCGRGGEVTARGPRTPSAAAAGRQPGETVVVATTRSPNTPRQTRTGTVATHGTALPVRQPWGRRCLAKGPLVSQRDRSRPLCSFSRLPWPMTGLFGGSFAASSAPSEPCPRLVVRSEAAPGTAGHGCGGGPRRARRAPFGAILFCQLPRQRLSGPRDAETRPNSPRALRSSRPLLRAALLVDA